MNVTAAQSSTVSSLAIGNPHPKDLSQRIWKAVIAFFTVVAQKIQETAEMLWITLNACLDGKKRTPTEKSLKTKLDIYKNMPRGNIDFLNQSIKILHAALQKKDATLAAHLRQNWGIPGPDEWVRYAIPKERFPNQLQTFKQQLQNQEGECFPRILMATIRAFIFSKTDPHDYDLTYFHPYIPQMHRLKAHFEALPVDKKEIILDAFEPLDIDQLDLPPTGKEILREIGKITHALVQRNRAFERAAQTVLETY